MCLKNMFILKENVVILYSYKRCIYNSTPKMVVLISGWPSILDKAFLGRMLAHFGCYKSF